MNFQKLNLMKNMDKPTFFDWKSYFGLKEDILKCFCSQKGLKMAKKEMFSPWLPENYEEHSYQNWQFSLNIDSDGILHRIWLTSKVSATDRQNNIEEGQEYCVVDSKRQSLRPTRMIEKNLYL